MALTDSKKIRAFNRTVSAWRRDTEYHMAQAASRHDLRTLFELQQKSREGRVPLSKSIVGRTKKEFGQIEIVRFSFWAHGWFWDRGVGKGVPLSRAGSTKRVANPWIDIVLREEVEYLADLLSRRYGDDVVDEMQIRN